MSRNFPFIKIAILGVSSFLTSVAYAKLSITAPAANSVLSENSILQGTCDGTKEVGVTAPGVDKNNRKVKCANGSWAYSLATAYPLMKDGKINVEVSQGDSDVEISYVKKAGAVPSPSPSATPTPSPTVTPKPSPSPSATPSPSPSPTPVDNSKLDPNKAPAANFNLSLWKVTLPIDSNGAKSGTAVEVKNISATYQKAPYFYTAKDGAMVFSAPTDGATTSGSHYPRSELRELTSSGANAAWTVEKGGTFSATLAVNEVPVKSSGEKGRVVIGQIHGPDDELCRLYYDNGALYFVDDKAGASLKETQFTMKSSSGATSQIPLNAKFSYTIKATKTAMMVSAIYQGVTYTATEPISSFWPGKTLYFKAGVYVQVGRAGSGAGTTGTGSGTVSFYELSLPTH